MSAAIKDLQEMVDILRQHGYVGDEFTMDVPVSYARALHAELFTRGIEVPYPFHGDEMMLELQNRAKVTMKVH